MRTNVARNRRLVAIGLIAGASAGVLGFKLVTRGQESNGETSAQFEPQHQPGGGSEQIAVLDPGGVGRVSIPVPVAVAPEPIAAPAVSVAEKQAPRRMTGIRMQEAEYYVASGEFNPDGKAPTPLQMAALLALVNRPEGELMQARSTLDAAVNACVKQKFRDGNYRDIKDPVNSQFTDVNAGVWNVLSMWNTDHGPVQAHIQIVTGEFASVDVARQDGLDLVTANEREIKSLISGW